MWGAALQVKRAAASTVTQQHVPSIVCATASVTGKRANATIQGIIQCILQPANIISKTFLIRMTHDCKHALTKRQVSKSIAQRAMACTLNQHMFFVLNMFTMPCLHTQPAYTVPTWACTTI